MTLTKQDTFAAMAMQTLLAARAERLFELDELAGMRPNQHPEVQADIEREVDHICSTVSRCAYGMAFTMCADSADNADRE